MQEETAPLLVLAARAWLVVVWGDSTTATFAGAVSIRRPVPYMTPSEVLDKVALWDACSAGTAVAA